jgi:hypothetical protein
MIIDANADGEIQLSEAAAVAKLDISSSWLTNVQGIEAFVNLTHFDGQRNELNGFFDQINALPQLQYVRVGFAAINLSEIVISNRPSLKELLYESVSVVNSIRFDNCPALEKIEITDSPLHN